jgi:subtilase family serine protease
MFLSVKVGVSMSVLRQTKLSPLLIVSILIFPLFCFGASDRITAPIVPTEIARLVGGVPLKAQPQFDRGPVDPSLKLSYMTLLTVPSISQRKTIDRLLAQQQDPQSPLYHTWLTPAQYADRFGLNSNDIHKIVLWLQSQGFTIIKVARARNFVVFSGTAVQVESTFLTPIHKFEVDAKMHFSNTTSPSVPAALAGIVSGIRGLSNFRPKSHVIHSKPGYTLPVSGGNAYFLAPGDIATIYDISPLYSTAIDGTGQTLAVMGQTDVYFADLDDFRNYFGLARFTCTNNSNGVITACNATNFKYVLVNADPGTPSTNDLAEADLDIEWSGAVARNAQIIYVNAPDPNGNGVWDSWYYAVDQNVSPVITMSYGQCELMEAEDGSSGEGAFSSDEAELKQANSEGITFMNSSGDDGAAGCDNQTNYPTGGYALSYPASSPEVTGVGGTLIPYANYTSTYWGTSNSSTGGSALEYIPEEGWNDAQEWSEYCAAFPSDSSCTSNPGLSSWATAQESYLGVVATGGGLSNCVTESAGVCAIPPNGGFPQPSWQSGLAIPGQSTAVRFSPDVSLLASVYWPGYIVCTPIEEVEQPSNDTNSVCADGIADALNTYQATFGGTSISTPIFAGIVTLINDYEVKNGLQSAAGLGNINPKLYQMAAADPDAFHKITSGSNGAYCQPDTPANQPSALQCPSSGFLGFDASNYDATTGYNLVTGLGSVDANNLATNWSGSSGSPDYSVSASPSGVTVSAGQSGTSTITVSASDGFSGTVSLSCSVSSSTAKMGCSLSPLSVSLSSTMTTATATITVTTTASDVRTGYLLSESNLGPGLLAKLGLVACVGLLVMPGPARRRKSRLSLVLLSLLSFGMSCGGGGNSGTPDGSYMVTVTGTSGSKVHTATVSISVQ